MTRVGSRDLHGPDSDGPTRPVDLKTRPVTARGTELSLWPGPFRPVACPLPKPGSARPGPLRPAPPRQKQFPRDFLKLLNTMMNFIKHCLFNEFVSYLYITDAPQKSCGRDGLPTGRAGPGRHSNFNGPGRAENQNGPGRKIRPVQ